MRLKCWSFTKDKGGVAEQGAIFVASNLGCCGFSKLVVD